ncbi:methyltransferase [Streptomyces sp. NPDC093260]|uniref:methyltransferase n=1 Tax=Streptomyces sp. NPDC093260 TaxID=3155073 RepID=UPI00342310D1
MRILTEQQVADARRMRQMLFGHLLSSALCTVVRLDVPDLLADGPKDVAELAATVDADVSSLRRLLRGLAMYGVFAEPAEGVFELTAFGRTLCREAPASARPSALLVSGVVGAMWGRLPQTVRRGEPAFRDVFGADFFEYLEKEPEVRAAFGDSQAQGLALELDEILSALDLGSARVVDVGGGDGAFLVEVLKRFPDSSGIVFDLPGTAALAERKIADADMAERCTVVAGDFFDAVPAGGDVYLLSHILHDWGDDDARAVLRRCAAAAPPHARLIVVDLVLRDHGDSAEGYEYGGLLDMYMMSLFGGHGGRERTGGEFVRLLESAGCVDVRVRRLPSGMACVEAGFPKAG